MLVLLLLTTILSVNTEVIERSGALFGEINSPGFPEPYINDLNTAWKITVPTGFTIAIYFRVFNLEYSENCEYDYVKVFNAAELISTFCGNDEFGKDSAAHDILLRSTGRQLTVHFRSDYSNERPHDGFAAHYYAEDIDECATTIDKCEHFCQNYIGGYYCTCRRGYILHSDKLACTSECSENVLTTISGDIATPDYPGIHPSNLDCDWTVVVEEGYVINIAFTDFDIEEHPDVRCPYDYLKIESDEQKLGPFCGSRNPANITSASNIVKITFHSDGQLSGRGFTLEYTTQGKQCVDIDAPAYGFIQGHERTFKSVVMFSCAPGYILFGSENRACQADGNWSGEDALCKILDCGTPPTIAHGSWTSSDSNFTFTNIVTYDCDNFYKLQENKESRLQCLSNGTWSPELPECTQICGVSSVLPHPRPSIVTSKISGGRVSSPGSWPWQVLFNIHAPSYSIINNICGGFLVNEQWVMTAAHCFNDTLSPLRRGILPASTVTVKFGVHSRTDNSESTFQVKPQKIIIHPEFDRVPFDADIALVKLNKSIQFSNTIRPLCLPEQNPIPTANNDNATNTDHGDGDDNRGVVIGWGRIKTGQLHSDFLREIYVPLVSRRKCAVAYDAIETDTNKYDITRNMFCAGVRSGGRDACQGDSGGPFMLRNYDNAYFAHGIVSWGNGCAKPGFYGVYTRVENFVDWANNIINTE
ncbi:mannan-binding lectin serine protease 1-like [Anneissia japonica]|uniref:mannan-binding lectin serine protease 1-like n=1 Tax=Anneissia japonica TaxID=1529436 RepID=UPI001425A8F4|nr:mannan-binding lectin serine protease 1-like [Anneissia japonica]